MHRLIVVILLSLFLPALAYGQDFRVATFNTESEEPKPPNPPDTVPAKVAETIRAMGAFDLLAVQEVESSAALKVFSDAAAQSQGGKWRYVISESGFNSDRAPDFLGIVYRSDEYRELETREIHVIRSRPDGSAYGQPDWGLRGALVLRLQHIASGKEFQVVTVHLKCCDEPAIRAHQTALLMAELGSTGLATILLGDTNIPIDPGSMSPAGPHQTAFNNITGAGLTWILPSNPIKTQCSEEFNSMLDQVYVSSPAAAGAVTEIKFTDVSYCAQEKDGYSDHRPMIATLPGFFDTPVIPMAAPDTLPTTEDPAALEDREFRLQQMQRPGDSVGM